MNLVFAVNPIIETGGQIAAIIICLFLLIFVLITLGFHLLMTVAMTWVREKSELVKKVRPLVESANETTDVVKRGVKPAVTENVIVRRVAEVPLQVQAVDKRVDQISDRVAKTTIEIRARTIQAQTIVKAFFMPGLFKRPAPVADKDGLEFNSPGYQRLMEQQSAEIPAATEPGEGYARAVSASQLKDVPTH